MYQHRDVKGSTLGLPVNKVICVGRNYIGHIKEMNNPVIEEPLLFLKPNTALCQLSNPLDIPKNGGGWIMKSKSLCCWVQTLPMPALGKLKMQWSVLLLRWI